MSTLQCSNSQCKGTIDIVPGLLIVICPHCGQWVEVPNSGGASPPSPSPVDYNYPPPPPADFPPENTYEPAPNPPPVHGSSGQSYDPWGPMSDTSEVKSGSQDLENESDEALSRAQPTGHLVLSDNSIIELSIGKQTIGRQGANIILADPSVSRKHCIIEVVEDASKGNRFQYFIADIGFETGTPSTNGVFLSHRSLRLQNNEKIPLHDGTIISLGKINMLFNIRKT